MAAAAPTATNSLNLQDMCSQRSLDMLLSRFAWDGALHLQAHENSLKHLKAAQRMHVFTAVLSCKNNKLQPASPRLGGVWTCATKFSSLLELSTHSQQC